MEPSDTQSQNPDRSQRSTALIQSATLAYLGPPGTYSEAAALSLGAASSGLFPYQLVPYPTIAATLNAVVQQDVGLGIVPVENSIEGGVSMTLDSLWQLEGLQIRQALILPVRHALISHAPDLESITTVYSHPQALAQCQTWLQTHLPQALQVATRSTTEERERVQTQPHAALIASERAAELHQLPILSSPINDHPNNCTRFWLVGLSPVATGTHTSLAFSLPQNVPGALLKPLQIFAGRGLNLSRIESRPTKQVVGTYVFFIDIEHPDLNQLPVDVIQELETIADELKIFGCYRIEDVLLSP